MIQNNYNYDNLNNPIYYAFTHLKKYSLPYDCFINVTYAMKFFLFITLKWHRSSNYQMPLHIFLRSSSSHLFQGNKELYMLCCSHSSHVSITCVPLYYPICYVKCSLCCSQNSHGSLHCSQQSQVLLYILCPKSQSAKQKDYIQGVFKIGISSQVVNVQSLKAYLYFTQERKKEVLALEFWLSPPQLINRNDINMKE